MISAEESQRSVAIPGAKGRWIPSSGQFFVILLLYFAFHVALRTVMSPHALELDEAEQVMLTQRWSWGYGSQPPLYCWLQIPLFQVFGASVLALSLLKNVLLFLSFVFTYLAAKQVTGSKLAGLGAAASLLFFPEIAWYSQIDRTHSVLALMLASATLYLFLRVAARPSLAGYALLGFCAGLALIAKYNMLFFLAGLPLAAMSVREYRPAVFDRRMLVSVGIMLGVFLPNGMWMLNHPQLALMTSSKFDMSAGVGLASHLIGLRKVVEMACLVLGPLLVVHGVIFLRKESLGPLKSQPASFRLLWRALLIILGAVCVAVAASGATSVRERWLQPILGFAPILSLLYLREGVNAVRVRQVLTVAAAVMIAVTIMVPGRLLLADASKGPQRLNAPIETVAREVDRSLGGVQVVVTDTWLVAGELRLNLPGRVYVSPEFAALAAADASRVGVVWDATGQDAPPKGLAAFLKRAGVDLAAGEPHYSSAPRRNSESRVFRLAVVIVEKPERGWPTGAERP